MTSVSMHCSHTLLMSKTYAKYSQLQPVQSLSAEFLYRKTCHGIIDAPVPLHKLPPVLQVILNSTICFTHLKCYYLKHRAPQLEHKPDVKGISRYPPLRLRSWLTRPWSDHSLNMPVQYGLLGSRV